MCDKHWLDKSSFVKVQGGGTKPTVPPSTFDIPKSLVPTKKSAPRKEKVEFASQAFFDKKDKFQNFSEFFPNSLKQTVKSIT